MRLHSSVFLGLALAALASGCGNSVDSRSLGQAAVSVSALTLPSSITVISLEAQPANVTRDLTYNATTGKFSGSIMLPVGVQTLTARAYAGSLLVGQGTATATIVAGQTASVAMKILDATTPAPMADVPPAITVLSASSVQPTVGDAVTLSVSAADANGDPLSYAWTSTCTTGAFSSTTSAQTTWTSTSTGVCTITVTVTANGKSASQQVDITGLDLGVGAASIEGSYIRSPQISYFNAYASGIDCASYPGGSPMCSNTCPPGNALSVYASFSLGEPTSTDGGTTGAHQVSFSDNCGGTWGTVSPSTGVYATSSWTSPAAPAVCVLTARVTQEGMFDERSMVIVVK